VASHHETPKKQGVAPLFLLAPYELTLLTSTPTVNTELIGCTCDYQSVFLGGDALADVYIVDAFAEPNAHIALATHRAVQNGGDFFGGSALDTSNADLPSSLVANDFAIAERQAVIFSDIADSADVNTAVGSVSHSLKSPFLLFEVLCVPLDYIDIIAHKAWFVNSFVKNIL
jgi:hypothetical protein